MNRRASLRLRLVSFACLLACAPRESIAAKPDLSQLGKSRTLFLSVDDANVSAEIFVNDIPVARKGFGDAGAHEMSEFSYVSRGANRLKIVVFPGQTPSSAEKAPAFNRIKPGPSSRLSVDLRLVELGSFPSDSMNESLKRVDWSYDPKNAKFPAVLESTVDLDLPESYAVEPPWLKGETIRMDQETRASLAKWVADAHRLLSLKKHKAFAELCELQQRRAAREPGSRETYLELQNQFAKYLSKAVSPLPLNEKSFDFRVVGNGKLVELIDKDWAPTLRLKMPEGFARPSGVSIFLARIEGAWRCVL